MIPERKPLFRDSAGRAARAALLLLAIGGAALLLAPPRAVAFTTLGGDLGPEQRHFRIFNNFTDPSANDNMTPDAQFPGHQGAVMALWKACIEWNSELHGTGWGDPEQPGDLGSGGANFDAAFAGEASSVGSSNSNTHSEISGGSGGVLAFTELPISDGWRIRYYQNWTWSDGPGSPVSPQIDLQGVGAHEYGHALGLDHTSVSGATMKPSAFTGYHMRSIESDDIAGVQFIYGAKSASKPRVTSASMAGTTVTITGTGFHATDNEVWFTNQVATGVFDEPLAKATSIASSSGGTQITLEIPGLAGPGDVLVKVPGSGHATVSNAYPFDGMGAGPQPPQISSITPSSIEAVNPGTDQIVQITGNGFLPSTTVAVNGTTLVGIPSPYTVVDESLITFAPPLVSTLWSVPVTVTNQNGTDTSYITYFPNDPPALEAGNGDNPVHVLSFAGLDVTAGSLPGDFFFLAWSPALSPSHLPGFVSLDIGAGFTSLHVLGSWTIGATGYEVVHFPPTGAPPMTTFYLQGAALTPSGSFPLPASNVQEVRVVF